MPEVLVRFQGRVSCEERREAPQLTLRGVRADAERTPVALAFSAAHPEDLPATLEDAVVESLGEGQYAVRSASSSWRFAARAVHLHEDVRRDFYRAIPPRKTPWARRIFFRVVLTLAASRTGLALLTRLRR
jgi:hypothetical protein